MRTLALAVGLIVLIAPVAEAAKAVRGRVRNGQGYVIVGTSASGQGVTQTLGTDGKFALRFPGTSGVGATLQLLSPTGRYFGPVVLRHEGGATFLALSGRRANLGEVILNQGWAAPVHAAPRKAVDRSRTTQVGVDGAPIGAGRLGVVATAVGALRAFDATGDDPHSAGADPDGDGIVNAYDADDDGDLILDNQDPDNSAEHGGVFSTLFVTLNNSLNANVGTVTREAIDASVHDNMNLVFFFDQRELDGKTIESADVDCHTLSYCAPDVGTGELTGVSESSPDLPHGPWVNYDPNGDGFPNLEPITRPDGTFYVANIRPLATTAEIAPGDAFDVLFTTPDEVVRLPRSLPPYFVTSPAVISYDVGAGPQAISYPVASDGPGTNSHPIAMTSEQVTLTVYRPQRSAIPGAEPGEWTDMGHLHWGIPLNANNQEVACAGYYSGLSSTLTEVPGGSQDFALRLFPLEDSAEDGAPDGSRSLSFTLDLGGCLRAAGVDPAGMTVVLNVTATGESRPGGVDRTAQFLHVTMPSSGAVAAQ
jgi:hypothetical protein